MYKCQTIRNGIFVNNFIYIIKSHTTIFLLTTIWTYILIKPYFKLKYCSSNGLMWMWLEQVCERACDWSKSHSSFIIKFWKQVLVYKWILGNYFQLQFLQAQSSGKLIGTELIISFICFRISIYLSTVDVCAFLFYMNGVCNDVG